MCNIYTHIGLKVQHLIRITWLQRSVCQRKLIQVFGNLLHSPWEAKSNFQFMFRAPDQCTKWTRQHEMVDSRIPRSISDCYSIKVCALTCSKNKYLIVTYMKIQWFHTIPTVDDYGQSPGPAAYFPCFPNFKRAPTPKLLLPIMTSTDGKRNIRPSPNTYSLRDEHQSSIKSRRKGYTM